jgi:hypothetical protein
MIDPFPAPAATRSGRFSTTAHAHIAELLNLSGPRNRAPPERLPISALRRRFIPSRPLLVLL